MVTKKLTDLSIDSENEEKLSKEIEALKVTRLHKLTTKKVEALLDIIFHNIEELKLVPIHVGDLAIPKGKKHQHKPIKHTEDEAWKNSSKIRKSFYSVTEIIQGSETSVIQTPKCLIYHDTDKSILGIIYSTKKGIEVLIKREIADYPVGAKFLIKKMNKKIS